MCLLLKVLQSHVHKEQVWNGQGRGDNWDEGTSYTSELVGDSQVGSTENGPRAQSHLWLSVMEPRPIHTAASHLWLCVMEPWPIHTAASHLWLCVMEPRPIHTAASHLWLSVLEPTPIHTAASPCITNAKTSLWPSGFTQIEFLKYHHIPDIEHQRGGYIGQTHQL